jgi:hypothetical protein
MNNITIWTIFLVEQILNKNSFPCEQLPNKNKYLTWKTLQFEQISYLKKF